MQLRRQLTKAWAKDILVRGPQVPEGVDAGKYLSMKKNLPSTIALRI